MFGRDRSETRTTGRHDTGRVLPFAARGGVSFGAILTGVVVAFGAMFVLTALISGILVALGLSENLTPGEQADVGIATGIGLVAAQLLSYMWGGYAAGRMSRGAGAANGALVALLALVVGVAVGAIAAGIGATEDIRTPFNSSQLPADGEVLRWGTGLAVGALAAMFLGAILGGSMGSRWHAKLERRTVQEQDQRAPGAPAAAAAHGADGSGERAPKSETIDLREGSHGERGVTSSGRRE
ncbi:MAG: hypothetical protein M3323_12400 [Actinomycetota bacterium]|nr:hypothetical protein [Actinomycetota bacterium]